MKVWKYDEKVTASNLDMFLEEFRVNCEACDSNLSDKETIPVILSFLREQYILAEIEERCGKLSSEQSERSDFGTVENLIILQKNLTSKYEYSDCNINDFCRDSRKFYFWFIQYVEVAMLYQDIQRIMNDNSKINEAV